MPGEATNPKGNISMRHSKLKASEAALLAGELKKPSWESRNEGIHERVSFEDSIWGFDLAGGSFYKTPLRVTAVKADSRADKAGIRPGDLLLKINDIETATLTIQEAHKIIIDSGIHLKINVTCPDDEEDSYYCWQDPVDTSGYDSEEERRKEREKKKKREIHAKVSSYWSLQWPWVSKRKVIYRESNCFMVPSKYEDNHRDKFPVLPTGPRVQDDLVHHSVQSLKTQQSVDDINKQQTNESVINDLQDNTPINQTNGDKEDASNQIEASNQNSVINNDHTNDNQPNSKDNVGDQLEKSNSNNIFETSEGDMHSNKEIENNVKNETNSNHESQDQNEDISELSESEVLSHSENLDVVDEEITESEQLIDDVKNLGQKLDNQPEDEVNGDPTEDTNDESKNFDSILASELEGLSKEEENRIIDDILSDNEPNDRMETDET